MDVAAHSLSCSVLTRRILLKATAPACGHCAVMTTYRIFSDCGNFFATIVLSSFVTATGQLCRAYSKPFLKMTSVSGITSRFADNGGSALSVAVFAEMLPVLT